MIEKYEELYGIDYIDFMDNNFAGGNRESRKICFEILDYIGKKGYPIGFSNGLTFESMMRNDFELLKKFHEYGNVAHLAFPCENANDRVLKMIQKPHNLEMINKTLKQAKKLLPYTNKEAFFIGGFPETFGKPAETPKEVMTTVYAIEKMIDNGYLDQAIFLTLSPVTAVYRKQWEEKNPDMSLIEMGKEEDKWIIPLGGTVKCRKTNHLFVLQTDPSHITILPVRCIEPSVLPDVEAIILSGSAISRT